STMNEIDRSYEWARRIARREAKNFYYGFLLLPYEKRRSLYAVYAYSRRLDDAVDSIEGDGPSALDEARRRLDGLRALIGETPPDDPLVPALRDTLARYPIERRFFEELAEGMLMDLSIRRYETFADLRLYCYRAASVIGRICLEIFGYDGAHAAHGPAEDLGLAMQLTNILRDVGEDLDRDRIYLPREDLERFGVSEDDLRRRAIDERIRALLRFQGERAREYFQRAEALYPLVDSDARYCPVFLGRIYSKVLDVIESRNWDVFSKRARLGASRKIALALKTWRDTRARRGSVAPAHAR